MHSIHVYLPLSLSLSQQKKAEEPAFSVILEDKEGSEEKLPPSFPPPPPPQQQKRQLQNPEEGFQATSRERAGERIEGRAWGGGPGRLN